MFSRLRISLRERLPSAAVALAVQAGLLALLVFSFEVVRYMPGEKETILNLRPLTRPAPARTPALRGGMAKPPPAAATAPPSAALPAYARPDFQFSAPQGATALRELNHDAARCRIENYANLSSAERLLCPPPDMVRRDPNAPPAPDKPVKNAPVWQGEVARRNAPATLPGGDIFGAAIMLLFNPSAFADKRNYTPGPAPAPIDGAEMTRQYALHGSGCPELDDTTKRNCQADRGALFEHGTGGEVLPANTHHATDAAFQQALAAVQARKQSLSAKPVLASGANKGGGDEKNTSSGGAGAAAGGGNGPDAGKGR